MTPTHTSKKAFWEILVIYWSETLGSVITRFELACLLVSSSPLSVFQPENLSSNYI